MELTLLAHKPEAIPIIAGWYFNEWGYLTNINSVIDVEARLKIYLNTDRIPLMVVAFNEADIIGTATLKYREMSIYPDKEHWLGGVYVNEKYRGHGIGTHIIRKAISLAGSFGVKTLHLQTENLTGGLYNSLGWRATGKVNYRNIDVLVMENHLQTEQTVSGISD